MGGRRARLVPRAPRAAHPLLAFVPNLEKSGDEAPITDPTDRPQPAGRKPNEAQLTRRMAAGEESALADAFDAYGGAAFALAKRILGSDADAEEVVQEVFLKLWRRAAEFDATRGSLAGYLMILTRSTAIDRVRHRRARPDSKAAPASEWLPTKVGIPLEALSIASARAEVVAALAELPAEERRVLELAYFEGLSQSEIAKATNTPLGTVKGRARNALRRLRERLPKGLGGERA